MRHADLMTGIGGFSLGLERAGMETVYMCDIDPFCQQVIQKHWPKVPLGKDIKDMDYDGEIDIITGGYPCQPFSVAGKQRAEDDERHLWPELYKRIQQYRPKWVICENVYGHIKLGLDRVLADLERANYTTRTFCVSAKAIGANHNRERIWIVANTSSHGRNEGAKPGGNAETNDHSEKRPQESGNTKRCSGVRAILERSGYSPWGWGAKPPALRVDDGLPNRAHRIKAVGNSVGPQMPEIIASIILEIEQRAREES